MYISGKPETMLGSKCINSKASRSYNFFCTISNSHFSLPPWLKSPLPPEPYYFLPHPFPIFFFSSFKVRDVASYKGIQFMNGQQFNKFLMEKVRFMYPKFSFFLSKFWFLIIDKNSWNYAKFLWLYPTQPDAPMISSYNLTLVATKYQVLKKKPPKPMERRELNFKALNCLSPTHPFPLAFQTTKKQTNKQREVAPLSMHKNTDPVENNNWHLYKIKLVISFKLIATFINHNRGHFPL